MKCQEDLFDPYLGKLHFNILSSLRHLPYLTLCFHIQSGNGPINTKRMEEMRAVVDVLQSALSMTGDGDNDDNKRQERLELVQEFARELLLLLNDEERRETAAPLIEELRSVVQMVAVEVLEIRSSRAIRRVLRLAEAK